MVDVFVYVHENRTTEPVEIVPSRREGGNVGKC
jgi:hypothetical protein